MTDKWLHRLGTTDRK